MNLTTIGKRSRQVVRGKGLDDFVLGGRFCQTKDFMRLNNRAELSHVQQ